MTSLYKIFLLALAALITLTACDRNHVDRIDPNDPMFEPIEVDVNTLLDAMEAQDSEGMSLGCVTVLYPFDLKTASDASISISSEEDFQAAVSVQAADPAVDFIFPLEVRDAAGKRVQMEDNAELGTNFANCTPITGWQATTSSPGGAIPAFLFDSLCFDLVYPVSLEDQNATPYTATSQGDFINLLATVDTLYFTLPLVVDTNGVQLNIQTQSEFLDLVYTCQGITAPTSGNGLGLQGLCSTLLFPFDAKLNDGTIVTVNDQNDYANYVLAGEHLEVVYPFSLEDAAGNVTVVNDDSALILVFIDCGLFEIDTVYDCSHSPAHVLLFFNALNILTMNNYVYEINYPVDLIVEGNPVTLNSDDQYLPAVGGSPFDLLETDLVYPITITQFGRDIQLNSDADVCAFYETLDEDCTNKPAHIQFFFNEGGGAPVNCAYFINYPVSITSNGSTIQIQTRDDYLSELNASPTAYNDIDLVYPVTATKFANGQQVNIGSAADMCQYLDNCQ